MFIACNFTPGLSTGIQKHFYLHAGILKGADAIFNVFTLSS